MWPFWKRNKTENEIATVYQLREGKVISFLSEDDVIGLNCIPGPAILGSLDGDALSPEGFRSNRAFIDLMHEVIASVGPEDSSMKQAAGDQKDGLRGKYWT